MYNYDGCIGVLETTKQLSQIIIFYHQNEISMRYIVDCGCCWMFILQKYQHIIAFSGNLLVIKQEAVVSVNKFLVLCNNPTVLMGMHSISYDN